MTINLRDSAEAGESPICGETNSGWETGDLTGWTQGTVTETIDVVGVESLGGGQYTVGPLEGANMVRLGETKESPSFNQQPEGPNELSQTFTVTNPNLRCAYYFWTFDWFGFDEITVTITRVSDGSTIYFARTGAFGPSGNTDLKGTGWRIVNVDLSPYIGEQVTLEFAAGGTRDDHYASWAYLDSASEQEGTTVVDTPATTTDGEPPMFDPATGQVVIAQSPGDNTLVVSTPIVCPDGSDPTSVTAILQEAPSSPVDAPTIEISLTKAADLSTVWTGTFNLPPNQADATVWDLNYTVVCPNDGTINVPVGQVILIDPSGFITDADTGDPIEGATVVLQRFDDGVWHDVNPFELVQGSPTISPQVNPLHTNSEGHYAWDVAAGKYRVVVSADGYITQTSYEVDIPPPVFDLNLALEPVGGGGTPTPPPGGPFWGDANCDGLVNATDAVFILGNEAGINGLSAQGDGCPALGSSATVDQVQRTWGDVDCSGVLDAFDALNVIRHDAGISTNKADGTCPDPGEEVEIGGATSTPTATATPTAQPPG